MNTQRKPAPITREELEAAIRKFRQSGGIISKLPDQPSLGHQSAAVKWGFLEVRPDPAT